LKPMVCRVW